MFPHTELITLVLITLCAAVVNGALGHGFSSITVPIALLDRFFMQRRSGGDVSAEAGVCESGLRREERA